METQQRGPRAAHLAHDEAVRVDKAELVAVVLRIDVHLAAVQLEEVARGVLVLPWLQDAGVPAQGDRGGAQVLGLFRAAVEGAQLTALQ